MTTKELVADMARAMAIMEGFEKEGSLAQRNCNPGNLRSWGSFPVRGGYAVFPSDELGWGALKAQIKKNIDRGLTMYEFFAGKPGVYPGYAPSADGNHPKHYAEFVAARVGKGIDPNIVLKSMIDGGGNEQD